MAPSELVLHTSPRATRSHSISSDRPSLSGYGGLLSPPASTLPEPAFIAASAASQIVTNDHDSQADAWFDQHGIEPSGETALVAVPALKLVNSFLDQLLFNFLSISKSTSLASLRPAVSEVLKPKLAKDAINGADQELQEYLGGGEDEELLAFHNGLEPSSDWDLELVWKRTRLRCMVYSSLGDMEEEDEDYYTEQEQLDGPPGSNNRFSNNPGVVSPAVAIFLTSILEFMGEQVLVVAGQAAYHRLRAKHEKEERDGTSTPAEIADRVVVEESDMERVALDRTLGRLWRGWKKRIRSPTTSVSVTRSFSRESMRSLQPQPISQEANIEMEDHAEKDARRPSLAAVLAEYEYAAGIALPISADDIREIEIPGLAIQGDSEEETTEEEDVVRLSPRPKSFMVFRHLTPEPHTPMSSQPQTPRSRKRANSLPSPAPTPYSSPPKRQKSTGDSLDKNGVRELEVDTPGESAAEGDGWGENRVPNENEPEGEDNKSAVVGVIAGTAAIETAVVSGMVAALNGQAPQTAPDDTEEDFNEEPQIMTSSRVSLSGQISPDDLKALSRRSSVRSPSVRSHSARSLRLVDVVPPKSPGRSRHGSVDAADYVAGRPIVISRPSSIHSHISDSQTPRISSPVLRGSTSSPIVRNASSLSTSYIRNSAGDSISEVEEKEANEDELDPVTAVPADLATAMQGFDVIPSPSSTSQHFAVDVSADHVLQKRSAFVLSAPPATRAAQATALSQTDPTAGPDTNLGIISTPKTPGIENGVPPLTPLREMMERAPDTSDEASSIAPSNDAHSLSEHGISGHSPSVSVSTIPHNQRVARAQPANVTRSSPPRSSREETSRKVMAEPAPKAHRAIHTSGSSSSSASHKLKPVRTSEEDAPNAFEDKGQSFEQLIRSDQTIQYTLTPQNMRNIEAPDSPRHAAPAVVPTPLEVQRPTTSRSHSSSVSKFTGLHSNPPAETPKSVKSAKSFKPVARQTSNTGARLRPNAPQARDARVDRDSMGDFAEFIRSTGPANSYEAVPPRSAPSHRGANGVARNVSSGSVPRTSSAASLPRRAESSAGRSRLQARDAIVPRGDSISDLIDFVRSGPQLEKENHRIPRTVAPFRTTMDSDQMSGAVGGKAIDASLPDPRYSQPTSLHSSVTSQSALLNNSSKNKPLPPQNRKDFEEEDMMPKRKTRRVRDPYAIDFSDDEDEYESVTPRPKAIEEESLADFLRNVPPPPEAIATSVFENVPRPISSKNIKKKSSTPGLMSRFSRNGSGPQIPPKPRSNGQEIRSQDAKRGAPTPSHTPIAAKYSTTSPSYEPTRGGNYVSQLDSARNKVAQRSYQPREAVYSSTRTNDLADFLLRSEPPTSLQTQPQTFLPTLQKEEASAFQRMFGRKKVH